ncbi:MAG: iron ABC transporter permease [Rothia sp. (in: high G+C Gram-positive bacteria)]|uniref:FecCD family ABC transporter permease n=1 Tax=Rothia sp. (in: high G+C Gram-positive bacteria) TaxID=1885016 RepID=UPI0026DF7DCA|nr:iron ABC transporter permease [Rothia sp. (in: high G+C Gram-positive bacteria)]MDO5750186.1 iron ABC transporter permease [Rothia sp. (in: high G+C Gram-positive bacteria)]
MSTTASTPRERTDNPADRAARAQASLASLSSARRIRLGLSALILMLLAACAFSILVGARALDPSVFWQMLSGQRPEHAEIIDARIVRTIWGLIIGVSLGLAGAGMQGITRNPLGDPGILGVNAGASFAVVTGIVFFGVTSVTAYSLLAFVGASLAAVLVYALAMIGKDGATPVKLALMGAAITAGLGSLTSAFILINQNALDDLRRWQVGSIAGKHLENLWPAGLLIIVGALIVLSGARTINNFALGDDMAASLGENVALKRVLISLGVTLLCGAAVALAGPIAFLGLMAPHAMRSLISADYRYLLPTSALFSAVILLVADTVGRFLLPPQEIQVGVMIIAVGVPVFIYLIRTNKAVNL